MKVKFALFLVLVCSHLFAQSNFSTTGFTMSIKGTSNLHDWESSVKEMRATGTMAADANGLQSVSALSVSIPVKSIKSTKGSVMDNKTYDALQANKHPNIAYKLDKAAITKKGDGYDIASTGSLTMAGVTNKVDMTVRGKVNGDGSVTFTGSRKIKMTDYKIKPPSALLGTVTVGDEVEVVFKVTVK
ncbi:MAG: YceI family protein [Lewinellaceae bacterium]|nr:YceI family protein [Lewinellaceae bacterium]